MFALLWFLVCQVLPLSVGAIHLSKSAEHLPSDKQHIKMKRPSSCPQYAQSPVGQRWAQPSKVLILENSQAACWCVGQGMTPLRELNGPLYTQTYVWFGKMLAVLPSRSYHIITFGKDVITPQSLNFWDLDHEKSFKKGRHWPPTKQSWFRATMMEAELKQMCCWGHWLFRELLGV